MNKAEEEVIKHLMERLQHYITLVATYEAKYGKLENANKQEQ